MAIIKNPGGAIGGGGGSIYLHRLSIRISNFMVNVDNSTVKIPTVFVYFNFYNSSSEQINTTAKLNNILSKYTSQAVTTGGIYDASSASVSISIYTIGNGSGNNINVSYYSFSSSAPLLNRYSSNASVTSVSDTVVEI